MRTTRSAFPADGVIPSLNMLQIETRPIPLAETRPLRREVLRPHLSLEDLASHEPAGSVAFGAFDGDDLVAVGLVGRDGEAPGDWRGGGVGGKAHVRGGGGGAG